jgi:S-adenosylmethionine hydrolase
MAILLFSDFGARDLYVGQIEAVFDRYAPGVRVIHLLHEAPAFDVKASAHLLAALAATVARGHVILGVVDPGVGTQRAGIVARIDGRTFVGPDNGLFSVLWQRSAMRSAWRITAHPPGVSASFHGRDIFAPLASAVVTGEFPNETVDAIRAPEVLLSGDDLAEVIYLDHYGNAFTGLRGANLPADRALVVGDRVVPHARVFGDAPDGRAFWYVNSIGLVEIAVPRDSAARVLGLRVGQPVAWSE